MCVDLKNASSNQQQSFSLQSVLLTIAGTVLVIALVVIGWKTAPGCKTVDDVLQIKPPQISKLAATGLK